MFPHTGSWVWFSTRPFKHNFPSSDCWFGLVFGWRWSSYSCIRLFVSLSYSPSSSVGPQWKDLGSLWTVAACRLTMPSWRCQQSTSSCWCVVGRHLRPGHSRRSDSAPRCTWFERGKLGSKLGEYCSYCRGRGESDPLWERPHPSRFSLATQLCIQQEPCPHCLYKHCYFRCLGSLILFRCCCVPSKSTTLVATNICLLKEFELLDNSQ